MVPFSFAAMAQFRFARLFPQRLGKLGHVDGAGHVGTACLIGPSWPLAHIVTGTLIPAGQRWLDGT